MTKESDLRFFANVSLTTLDGCKKVLLHHASGINATEADCPIVMSGGNHYGIAQFLTDGGVNWSCPFCGEEFSI